MANLFYLCRLLVRTATKGTLPPLLFTAVSACLFTLHAESWKLQFHYDKDASSLELRDLQCPSAKVCVAAGAIVDTSKGRDKVSGAVVLTSDGGEHWSVEDLKEVPRSIFFLNDTLGWMVTEKGIWQSAEAGRDWKKLKSIKDLERVWFVSESHGWAVGAPKAIYETNDSGREWAKVPAADLSKFPVNLTTYDNLVFSGARGLISGTVAPESMNSRRGASAAVLLETNDSAQTWKALPLNIAGRISWLRFVPGQLPILAVVEFFGKTEFPAEVFALNLETGKATPVFLQKDKVARDLAVLPGGQVIVAAVDRVGELSEVPIPSKLRMMSSGTLETWLPEKADYRATAMRPVLAAADANHVWVATDTGMILKRN